MRPRLLRLGIHARYFELALAAALLALVSCGGEGLPGPAGADGTDGIGCQVTDNGDGTRTIVCADGTVVITNGGKGDTGDPGIQGDPGDPGDPGAPGLKCTVIANSDGTKTIKCDDGTQAIVTNGQDGLDLAVNKLHGEQYLRTSGNFGLPVNPSVLVDVTVTSASASVDGVVTVNFKVMNGATPVTNVPSAKGTIAHLIPQTGDPAIVGATPSKWESYLYTTATAGVGPWNSSPWFTPSGNITEQTTSDSTGTFVNNGNGNYTYTFAKNIASITTPLTATPITYDRSLTHRVAIMIGGKNGPTGDGTLDFVPAGGSVTATRDIVNTATCKQCHGFDFKGHGDRRQVETCMTCHTDRHTDAQTGESLDMRVMIHKIHAGGELPTSAGPDGELWDDPATGADESADNIPYAIFGNTATSKHEWTTVGFPAIIENCQKCHDETNGKVDNANWRERPSRGACGSCHNDFDFTVSHGLMPAQSNDTACGVCHIGTTVDVEYAHDWLTKDVRNISEYLPEMTITNTPAHVDGLYFAAGDPGPIVRIRLRDNEVVGHPYVLLNAGTFVNDDGVTAVPPGDGPEGCEKVGCPSRDGKFTSSAFFVSGPRALRKPVLSYKARVVMKSTQPGPFSFAISTSSYSYSAALALVVDGGEALHGTNSSGGDVLISGNLSIGMFASGASGEILSSSDSTHFIDATQSLNIARDGAASSRDHQYAGWWITFTDGSLKSSAQVLDNVGDTVTLVSAASVLPPAGGHIVTYAMNAVAGTFSGQATGGSDTTLTMSSATWSTNQFKNFTLSVLSGTGAGQSGLVASNTDNVITLTAPLATAIGSGALFMLTPIDNTSASSGVPNLASISSGELVTLLNANATFSARALAYLDDVYIGGTFAAATAAAATTFTVAAGTGANFPASGTVVVDRLTGIQDTCVGYTRATDTFTVPGGCLVNAHGPAASIWVKQTNVLTIRSRNKGTKDFSLQLGSASANQFTTSVFPADAKFPVHVLGSNTPGATNTTGTASTVSNSVAMQTDPTKNDPLVTFGSDGTSQYMEYQLDPVDDLEPGTYIAKIEWADRGSVIGENYKTPTVARLKFNVKTPTEERPVAANCGSCHTSGPDVAASENNGLPESERGFVLDYLRHHKVFNNTAVDLCGSCHDYQPQNSSGEWSGALPISRRVHAVHYGAELNYPNATVGHADEPAGRNWKIEMPQTVRNCDGTCHQATGPNPTSGTWATKPARLPCSGCHDSDATQAHFRTMTYDPTPAAPYSGDEVEACKNCHAP